MPIFAHLSIGVRDIEAARRFYDAALAPLGITRLYEGAGDYFAAFLKDPDGQRIEAVCHLRQT